jgi:hypothetical protein
LESGTAQGELAQRLLPNFGDQDRRTAKAFTNPVHKNCRVGIMVNDLAVMDGDMLSEKLAAQIVVHAAEVLGLSLDLLPPCLPHVAAQDIIHNLLKA